MRLVKIEREELSILSQLQPAIAEYKRQAELAKPFNSFPVAAVCPNCGYAKLTPDFQFFPSCSRANVPLLKAYDESCALAALSILSQLQLEENVKKFKKLLNFYFQFFPSCSASSLILLLTFW
jgi:rubredoxin